MGVCAFSAAGPAAAMSPISGCTHYAAPGGSDANPGTLRAPFRTAQKLATAILPGETGCLAGGTYTVMGNDLPIPPGWYGSFARWHLLSMMRAPKTLRDIAEVSQEG